MSLNYTNNIFYYSQKQELDYLNVRDDDITELGKSIWNLSKKLNHHYKDEVNLRSVFLMIRNHFLAFTTSLVPFKELNVDLDELRFKYRGIKASYPDIYDDFLQVAKLIKIISEREDNPLLNEMCGIISKNKDSKICIVTRRLLTGELMEKFYSSISNQDSVIVMKESVFKKTTSFFDLVLFIGSEQYFHPFANNLYRGKKTIFISYDVFRNYFTNRGLFNDFNDSYSTIYTGVINNIKNKPLQDNETIELEEIQSVSQNIKEIFQQSEDDGERDNIEYVDAIIVTLESDYIVMLEKDANYKVLDSGFKKLISKTVSQIDLDDFLIIFNERESAITGKIADKYILKDKAKKYRAIQRKWKERLQWYIDKYGYEKTSRVLIKRGVKSAKTYNLKNCLIETSILPTELETLLLAIGFSEKNTVIISKVCNNIHSAHIKAGKIIRRMAEEEIKKVDNIELFANGSQEFEISKLPGVTFMVERIVGIDRKTINVPQYRIMQLYDVNEFR